MELVKNFTQSKIIKSVLIALIGSLLLAISSKIKDTILSCANDNANNGGLNDWNWIWLETWCCNCYFIFDLKE